MQINVRNGQYFYVLVTLHAVRAATNEVNAYKIFDRK